MLTDYIYVLMFILGGLFIVTAGLTLSRLFRPTHPTPDKISTYECGERPIGEARGQYDVKYYLYALLFVIFDIEAVFLIPWAVSFKSMGSLMLFSFIEMVIFIAILLVALLYAWKKGILTWE
ncbi:MAG: NADH-quinone oxidoreductase subunit A [Candidatus Eremiobacteraeota bacterium]|nr:NADH-quinone oxidoreductase subunit A [Candidatus Eremiobacteraeota bacterium]